MRYFLAFALLATSLSDVSVLRGADALFSEVAMESVFEKTPAIAKEVASQGNSESIDRITGNSTLIRVLKAAGLEPEEKDDRVKLQLQHAGWKFPVTLEVQIEHDRIECRFSLIEAGKGANLDQQVLLRLLSAGDAIEGAFFAYDQDLEMIELRSSIGNRAVTATRFRAELDRLATVAEDHSDQWLKLKPTKKSQSAPKPTSKSTTNSSFSLVGRWSASAGSDQAFAIQIDAKGPFRLVHLSGGKSTISKGKATRKGNQLTLAGDDGTSLSGTISWLSASEFQFAISDAQGKVSARLKFKKQNSSVTR